MPICHTYGVLPWSLMVVFMKDFLQPNAVYIRFTHIVSMQPKIYVGSATRSTLDREIRTRKYLQLEHDKLSKLNVHYVFGVITTISLFGLQSIFLSCSSSKLSMSRTYMSSRMATSFELPINVPIPSILGESFEEASHEYQCPIWPCFAVARVQTQVHPKGCT